MIEPQQASGACKEESLLVIYAAETEEEVIPFALPIRCYPDMPGGRRDFTCQDGKTKLIYGSLNPHGVGYVYKIKADTFEKIDGGQWVSGECCIPVEVKEISVEDYIHTVEFSEEAKEINRLLFGE